MEDFGYFGDETLLDAHNFALEMSVLAGMALEEQEAMLREYQDEDEDEDALVDFEDDCPMDGDAESALASCGWGTDEDYGFYENEWFYENE